MFWQLDRAGKAAPDRWPRAKSSRRLCARTPSGGGPSVIWSFQPEENLAVLAARSPEVIEGLVLQDGPFT